MTRRLFIIGNGFDLHYGIDSRYSDFASYLEDVDQQTFRVADEYVVPEKDLWSYLEERFAEIDVDRIEEYAENFLASYGADDWSDSGHHDYEYEIERICDSISLKLRGHFGDWIRQLEIPNHTATPVQCIDPAALFLNFNYTATLQRLYDVPDGRILHIHGAASDATADIILGHGWERQAADLHSRLTNEDTDVRVAGGFQLIDELLAKTFKPTREILARNSAFFASLASVTEAFVLGHSLAQVDEPYFRAVIDHVRPDVHWTVSFYGDQGATRLAAESIGIPTSKLRLVPLRDL
ncbi:bacteriophage abortive infection AbiH family protein [Pleomorphomonas koreensis]|uniref:bacteriophage abortive infection AbiH family protein n=1 Tax=Pleomorphomonas koreensis TaxID=257440 RepID=UPI000478DC1E|nr:bacteriophage abortive infection AbiH family protein [Pleomorphomonas koreensis]